MGLFRTKEPEWHDAARRGELDYYDKSGRLVVKVKPGDIAALRTASYKRNQDRFPNWPPEGVYVR